MVRKKQRQQTRNALLLVEGLTEENYFTEFKANSNISFKSTLKKIKNANSQPKLPNEYRKFSMIGGFYSVIVVMDKDRDDHSKIKAELEKMLSSDKKSGHIKEYFIAENNPNFDTWLCCHFPKNLKLTSQKQLMNHLKFKSTAEMKKILEY